MAGEWWLALLMFGLGLVIGVLLRLIGEQLADIDLGRGEDWWI